jgi:hypothetical protein
MNELLWNTVCALPVHTDGCAYVHNSEERVESSQIGR